MIWGKEKIIYFRRLRKISLQWVAYFSEGKKRTNARVYQHLSRRVEKQKQKKTAKMFNRAISELIPVRTDH